MSKILLTSSLLLKFPALPQVAIDNLQIKQVGGRPTVSRSLLPTTVKAVPGGLQTRRGRKVPY